MEFKSAHQALKWAYRVMASDLCKTSSVYSMSGAGRDAARELTGHERHAQAAMIVGRAIRAVGDGSAGHGYLLLQYGSNAAGIDAVVRHIAAGMGTGMHSRRGIEKCVRCYCGQTISMVSIRTDLKVSLAKAQAYRQDIYRGMDLLHHATLNAVDDSLRVAGLIVDEA